MRRRASPTTVDAREFPDGRMPSCLQQMFRRGNQIVTQSTLKLHGTARWLLLPALLCCVLSGQARAQNENNAAAAPSAAQTEQTQPGDGAMRLLPQLNLSDEQRTQLVAIARQHSQDQFAVQQRLRQARRALNQALDAENPDQNVVNERARDVATAQEVMIRLNAQTELKVRQVLTPEQLRTFRRLRNEQRRGRQLQRQLEGGRPRAQQPDRTLNPNRPPAARPNGGNNTQTPADLIRERRRQRRLLRGANRQP